MKIKFNDLAAQNRDIHDDVERAFEQIHRNTAYVGGAQVEAFERDFAEYLGVRRLVGVSSGTDALRLALLALGIGPGDEVITVPMTFIATAEAIVQTGARPVFVDVDPATCNMSVPALRRYLEAGRFTAAGGPKAIVPVHLYGLPAPIAQLSAVANEYGLAIVEDACQAHGARVAVGGRWVRAGSVGDAGCFSFYPGKNLGAWGDGGAVATNDSKIAERIASLRDHGRLSHYAHSEFGYNARLDALQAAVLQAKLKRLDAWNARRRKIAQAYIELLADCGLELPVEPAYAESCYHLFVVRGEKRDALRSALLASQIECGIHYPVPLHVQPSCRNYGYQPGDFPNSERAADAVLSLPMHPYLTDPELERVADVIQRALEERTSPANGPVGRTSAYAPASRGE
jgi:dTDP-4-amino-4,6-dideoxygalactose transaminase